MKNSLLKPNAIVAVCGLLASATMLAQSQHAILPQLLPPSISTVPANGDTNPYGVAVVPRAPLSSTVLQAGDVLVSNFNGLNSQQDSVQGTGTTIVRINQQGQQSLFYQGQGLGFTGALGILADGIVVAGSLPTTDGTAATATSGSLLFIDPNGKLLMTISGPGPINGPWGLAIHDFGGGLAQVFVSNILNGTVMRFDVIYNGGGQTINVVRTIEVGSGYSHRPNPGAVVLGPSGLAYDATRDVLYVANSADNAIYAIPGAGSATGTQGTGGVVFNDTTKLHGPVNLALAPNGHLIVSNSDGSNSDKNQPSELVEFTPAGQFIGQYSVDESLGGAFGFAVVSIAPGVFRVVAADDNSNTLNVAVAIAP